MKPLYLAMAGIFSSFADAGAIIPDSRDHSAPTMNQSANGTPVINIVDPNASGISHNKFTEFNVNQEGVIFNNSTTDGASKIGGFVIKNDQLNNEANAIISEVTGTKGTQINGAMEVFGKKADVIIANQNGISVNGVSTVNANNLTLTTGKINPQADGRIQLSVEKGTINIEGQGISTEGLGYFDIISRSAVLEGEIAGQADIKMVTGLNDYDIQSRTHTVRDANASDRPEVSIDGSALGSMYGGRIQLISTESGAGVRHEGSIIGNQSIEISANGDLRLSGLKSDQGSVALAGNNVSIQKNSAGQGGIDSQWDLMINALGHVDIGADAISQQGRIIIDASSMLQNAATLMAKNGQTASVNVPSIQINVANEYQIVGSLYAVDQSGQTIPGAVVSLENGDYVVRRNGQVIEASVASNAQVVSNSGDVVINAKSAKNNNGGIVAQKGALVLNIDELVENNGMINASGKLTINTRAFKNKGIIFTDSQLINTGSLENTGGLYAQNTIDATTDSFINSGKMSSTDGDIQLNVNGTTANNSGSMAAKNITINQKNQADKSAIFVNDGSIDTNGSLHINSDSMHNSGQVTAGTVADLALTKELKNSGEAAEIIAEQDLLIHSNLADHELSIFNEAGWIQGGNIRLSDIDTISNTANGTLIANNAIELTNINNIFNDDSLIKADSVLLSHVQNINNTQDSVIEGSSNLQITDVNTLNNNKSSLQSDGDVSISNVSDVSNVNGLISSGGILDINHVENLLNTAVSTIQASAALLIDSVTSLENTEGSSLISQDVMNIDTVKNIHNDASGQIISETALNISNAESLENAGKIQSNSNLSIENVLTLLNSGESSLIAALDNLTMANITNLSNTESATLSAGLELVLNSIGTLINNAALIQSEDTLTINAANLTNLAGNIQSYGDIVLNITNILENLSTSGIDEYDNPTVFNANLVSDGTIDIHANTLVNNSEINATNVLVDVNDLNNTSGNIEGFSTADLRIKNDFVNQDGTVRGNDKLSLDMAKDFVFDEAAGDLLTTQELSIHSDGNIEVRDSLESMGDIILDAGKDITNYFAIVSNQDITLKGKNITNAYNAPGTDSEGNPVAGMSSLIWAFGDVNIDAREGTFHNQKYGNVLSVGDMSIIAHDIINDAGIIRSEGDMALDAQSLSNLSEYSGGGWQTGALQEGEGFIEDYSKVATYVSWRVETYLPVLSSDLTVTTKAEISSGGKIDINQRGIFENTAENPLEVLNEGGMIQSVGDMTITGNLTNKPKYTEASLYEYVTTPLEKPIVIEYYWKTAASGGDKATFDTVYSFMDWLFSDGNPTSINGYTLTDDMMSQMLIRNAELDKDDFLKSVRKAAGGGEKSTASPQLNSLMTMMFGESWITKDLNTLRSDWENISQSDDEALKEKGFYFLPNDTGSIVTLGTFTHNGGELNNGIGDFAIETGTSDSVNVEKVGDQEIAPIGGSTEVLINLKDIEEYRAGISPMSTIDAMSKMPAMFPYSPEWNQRNTGEPSLKDGPSNTVTPVFETRFDMIDQSQYYGSDYFFEQVGYVPDEPVYVIGDNYYISELIRRQVNDSVGSYFAVRDGVDGVDMVQMLMDNANYVVNNGVQVENEASDILSGQTLNPEGGDTPQSTTHTEDLGLVVGEPLTEEQRGKLDKDIVWFVNQTIDGEQVLVPFVYLSNATLDAMSTGAKESSGSAVIHAEGDVNIDATQVNNNNAVISAGNDVNITSEGDINNTSNGASGGISAGNNVDLTTTDGSINNNGAYIKAGDDINMSAENGSIEITASVGRDEEGKQQVHTYDDAISAGGNINMKAKDITSNAAIIEAGNDINMKSTEGSIIFNEMHEISAEYANELDKKNALNFTHTETETTTATAIESKVSAGGKLNIDSAEDVVMKGGEYSGTSGNITAAGKVDLQATQDYEHTESVVEAREFTLTGNASAVGYTASGEYSARDGGSGSTSQGNYEFDYGSENGGAKNPGKSAVAPATEVFVGFRSSTDESTSDSTKNQNASFKFSDDLNIEAKIVDIGGADLKAGDELNITADELKTTKYLDKFEETSSHEALSVGITSTTSSVFLDVADKNANMIANAVTDPDVGFDALTTSAQVAGDITNLIFNDYASINTTYGVDYSKSSSSSSSTSENITHIDAGKVNIKTKGDATLDGVEMKAGEVAIEAGGDVNMRAAEQTTSYKEDGMNLSIGITAGAAVDRDSAGGGVSLDASGGNNHTNNSSKSSTNTTVDADHISIISGNNVNLIGADVTADTADVKAGGNMNIISVQDTVDNDSSSWHAGVSIGAAITTQTGTIPIPTASVNAGGGSDFLDSATTGKQSGIHTKGELNVETGGDMNMTGGQLISDDHTGTVDVAGNINAQDLIDTTKQDGAYGGGGGGMTKTGASVNIYAQTTDEIDYQENQHSTIEVGDTKAAQINGNLNTDGTKISDVVKDEKEWGSDIAATVSWSPSKTGSYDVDTPNTAKPKPADTTDGITPRPTPKPDDVTPTPQPKPEPTPEPTPQPKPEPTPEPTPQPKPEPTPEPTPQPTPEPTPEPTPTPKPDESETQKTGDDTTPAKPDADDITPQPKPDADDNTPQPKPDADDNTPQPKPDADDITPQPKPDADDKTPQPKPADDTDTPKPRPSEYNGKKWEVKTPERVVLTPGSATGNTTWIEPPKSGPGKNGSQFEGLPKSGSTKARDTSTKTPATESTPDVKKADPSEYNGKKWTVTTPDPVVLSPGSNSNNITPNDPPRDGNKNNGTDYEGQPVRKDVQLPDGAANWQSLMPEHVMASEHTYQETEWSESNTPINQRGTKNA
ncbi:hemagglutinin repeat-containing protein [Rahnella perminowiae]|uniref:two-partner secretion domain-containing protein n=1 Tax=Rahnella perminowiae TaxID=2816244 RepID=UPI00215C81CB|nr:hemagglutinin repeat-containing protein [Rahnella perminowiae]MCR8998798.1 hemagglutinin repeat-containing protein [Rahnella perminowiae]